VAPPDSLRSFGRLARRLATIAAVVCALSCEAVHARSQHHGSDEPPPAPGPAAGASEARGVTLTFSNITDVSALRGGSRLALARMLLDVGTDLDLQRALGWRGTTARVQFLWKVGTNGAAALQDLQGFSNIDTRDTVRLGELWIEQAIGSRLRVKVGQVDANGDFARSDVNGDFINASMGYSPTIFVLPSYPNPVTSGSAFVTLAPWLQLSGGVFHGPHRDAAPETLKTRGLFLITEGVARWKALGGTLPGKAVAGAWHHTGRFASLLTDREVRAHGFYAVLDQAVWAAHRRDAARPRALALFVKAGNSDPAIALFDRHVAGGLTWTEPFVGRADDVFGLGSTWVRLRHREAGGPDHEMSFGPFYKWQAVEWFSVQPDVQVITRRTDGRVRMAFTCRSEVAF
jgi:carbohydrate-selective porin OprB